MRKVLILWDRRDVIRTRGLRFAPVGSIPTSPGRREPSAPERLYSVRERSCVRPSNMDYKNGASPMEIPHFHNRRDVIRTRDLCVPNAALYQAEPRAALVTLK